MRAFPAVISVTLLGLLLGGCSDDKADPIADMASWQVGCVTGSGCGSSLAPHVQSDDDDVDVSCGKSSSGFEIELSQEGDGVKRPSSTVTITRINPANNSCTVIVKESETVDAAGPRTFTGTCGEGCTITGDLDTNGWDFVGQVQCTKMISGSLDGPFFTLTAAGLENPVPLKVDNCN